MHEVKALPPYAYVAEFESADDLVAAAKMAHEDGYSYFDAYAPFPVHGLPEAIGFDDPRLKWMIFMGGCAGGVTGFLFQYWVSAYAYAHNVGGRPYFSWPAFIPVTFECTVLFSALTAVLGMLALNKLPQPHHPIFNTPRFDRASQDAFFLAIETRDPKWDAEETKVLLERAGALSVSLVAQDEEGDW